MTRVVSCYKTLVLLLAHKDSVTVTSITRTISKKSVINNSDEKPINDRFLRSWYVLTKTTGDQLSKRRKRRRQERKVVVMLKVSLERLRDDSGWKDATFPFPLRLMICYQRRHLESALNQFISFVFNHPTGAFGQSTIEKERHREERDRKNLQGKPFDRENISPSKMVSFASFPLHLD